MRKGDFPTKRRSADEWKVKRMNETDKRIKGNLHFFKCQVEIRLDDVDRTIKKKKKLYCFRKPDRRAEAERTNTYEALLVDCEDVI